MSFPGHQPRELEFDVGNQDVDDDEMIISTSNRICIRQEYARMQDLTRAMSIEKKENKKNSRSTPRKQKTNQPALTPHKKVTVASISVNKAKRNKQTVELIRVTTVQEKDAERPLTIFQASDNAIKQN